MPKLIRAIIYAIISLPLLITPFTIFPTHFGRVMIFQMLVVIGLALLLVHCFKTKSASEAKHPLMLWLVLFIGAMTVASIFGENFTRSLEGVYFRNNGLIIWFHLLGFFVLLKAGLETKADWRRLFVYFVGIGTVVATLGILQRFTTIWPGLIDQSGRVSSTIGNPIFLGAYLLFVFFLAIYLLVMSPARRGQVIWAVCLILNLIAIYLTESGGVFLGLLAGLILLIGMLVARTKIKWVRLSVIGTIIFLGLGSFIFWKYQNEILSSHLKAFLVPIDRVTHISLNSGTAQTRVWAWQMGLSGIKAHPFLGWGVANFETVADRYYNPKFLEHSFAETVWDRPHNILIEVAVESGLVGLLFFILLWVMAWRALWTNTVFTFLEKTIFSGMLMAYLVQNNFGIDTLATLTSLMMMLAFLGAGLKSPTAMKKKSGLFVMLSLVGLGLVFFRWSVEPLRAGYYLNQADQQTLVDGELWESNALKVLNYHGVYADDFRLALARNILTWDGANTFPYIDLKKGLLTLIQSLEDLTKRYPNHFNYHYYLGQLYQILGERADKKYFDRSEQELLQARRLSPNRQAVTFVLGKNYFLAGDLVKAKKELEAIIKLYPDNLDGHLYYGLILLKSGDIARGTDEFILLAKADYNSSLKILFQLGDLIKSVGQYDKLVSFYEAMLERHPKESAVLAKLAQAQWLAGQKLLAEDTMLRLKNEIGPGTDIDTQWALFKKQTIKKLMP